MSGFSFGKRERLAKRAQFEYVIQRGHKHRIESFCTLFFLPNSIGTKRLGIIASRKIGNAVVRNRAKRKIREIFRHIKSHIEPSTDVVIIAGKDLNFLPGVVLERKISKSLPVKRGSIKQSPF
jgi:ribonuclease P protein component